MANFREKLRAVRLRQVVYPAVTLLYIGLVAVLFIITARFVSDNINRTFFLDMEAAESQLIRTDMETFYRVAVKLDLPARRPAPVTGEEEPAESPAETPTPAATEESPAAMPTASPPADKKSLAISVLNTTRVTGLAAEMRTVLQAEGFTVSGIGNAAPARPATILQIKDSKKEFAPSLSEIIGRKYTLGAVETLAESEKSDVIILLGPPNQ